LVRRINITSHSVYLQTEYSRQLFYIVEPVVKMGDNLDSTMWDDGWTLIAEDYGISAQYEHTILITKHGAEILTLSKE
jgi:methionyl aminopeptidase